ncbi:MAG: crotonase [Firmicutes bacterium HGW-Firmicutes-12]|jgi:enoyl-CoA hydratase|nr:MAG: crotonase [Firmicutes bacterium HGW-Firmicutes-12]
MAYNNLLTNLEEGIYTISINRPDALNALSVAVLTELLEAIRQAKDDDEVKLIIITGHGEKAFAAGADIAEMRDLKALEAREYSLFGQGVYKEIENIDKPTIAAINGYALGGGCELIMACDIRIASEKAKLALPEVGLGIIPGWGGMHRLPRLIGKGQSKFYVFTGEMMTAAEAHNMGLVDKVVPADELIEYTKKIAKTILSKAPISIKVAKAVIDKGMNMDPETGIDYLAEAFATIFSTEDYREGLTAFLEKRKADFKNK